MANLERESKKEKTAEVMLQEDLTRDTSSRNNGIIVITGAAWRERDDKEISLCLHQSKWSHTITSDATKILR